jgi:hypothetical protein
MKALSSHPLDDDIVDRIFLFLPDFETLQAAILGSKSMYSVFSAHPHSIVKAIAFNLVGPALLSAINVLRCQPPDDPWTFGHALPESTEVGVITPEDARKLSRNALVVNTFQDIFSSRLVKFLLQHPLPQPQRQAQRPEFRFQPVKSRGSAALHPCNVSHHVLCGCLPW